MLKENFEIIEQKELPEGLEIDLDSGWRNLICRQFGGSPYKAFPELIQNLLDAYSGPWEERKGLIETTPISITDFGEGMDRVRILLLTTVAGTDKHDNPDKIGKFGIGFYSIFNKALGTKNVCVDTKCEGTFVRINFRIIDPDKRPEVEASVLDDTFDFSTRITVTFDNTRSSERCLEHAEKVLKYYPCKILINGEPYASVWDKKPGTEIFKTNHCRGFFSKRKFYHKVNVLCKFEHIIHINLAYLALENNMKRTYDLQEYHASQIPFISPFELTINCNTLAVTLSRDSIYLNRGWRKMVIVIILKV